MSPALYDAVSSDRDEDGGNFRIVRGIIVPQPKSNPKPKPKPKPDWRHNGYYH